MRRRRASRAAVATRSCAVAALLLLLPLLAGTGSNASFTAVTSNRANSWATETLDAPTGLRAVASGSDVDLSWTATADTWATGHRVYRSTSPGGPYTHVAQLTPRTTTSYTETPPAAGTYYYVVRAYHLSWESAGSNEDSATVTGTPTWDTNSSWAGNGSTESWSHTVGAGSNRILIVTTAAANQQATAVTFNAQPLTLVGTEIDGDDASRISMWYLVNPAIGTGTVQVTFSGAGQEKVMGASSWTGVHQTTPIGSFASQSGSGTTPSVTVSSAAGEVVVDSVSNIDAGSLTVDPSQTEHWNLNNQDVTGGHSSEPGATSVTMSWTMPSDFWAIGAVALKPA